jgi:hypothetical protein
MSATKNIFRVLSCIALSFTGFISAAHAHDSHHHKNAELTKKPTIQEAEALQKINFSYLKNVKPIFQKSCFDCHTSDTQYPWYAKLPGVKQLIESDITESKQHVDFSNDFPFSGHGTPIEDLKAIEKATENGSMPPFRYRIMHPGTRLTDDEKVIVKNWTQASLTMLELK